MTAAITVADLAGGAAHAPLIDADGGVIDPLVAVDLSVPADRSVVAAAVARARTCERVLVGFGAETELQPALDLTLVSEARGREAIGVADPVASLAGLRAAAGANPHATLLLAHVLRTSAPLPEPDALEVESLAYSTLLAGPEFASWLAAHPRREPRRASGEPVLTVRDGGALRITLNQPQRRNAYGRAMRDALADALRVALADDGIEQVLLDGAGPCFCAGGDLDEFGTTPDPVSAHLLRTAEGAAKLLIALAERTEARVHGACVGAGVELAAFAHSVVADATATFRLPETAMGLLPGAGGTVSIPRRIGRWRTLYLALSGAAISAELAHTWRLIDRIES